MKKKLVLLSCVMATGAFASQKSYWYNFNTDVCTSAPWCKVYPGAECCSTANLVSPTVSSLNATKDGYILRGWTKTSVGDVSSSTDGLDTNLLIDKDGIIKGLVNSDTEIHAAWARECSNNVSANHATCIVTVENDGSVSYETHCHDGYTESLGSNTWNPVCTKINTPIESQWTRFVVPDANVYFHCQRVSGADECPTAGCYKTQNDCSDNNIFYGLDEVPTRSGAGYFEYSGSYFGNTNILDSGGALVGTNWQNITDNTANLENRWRESKINLKYVRDSSCSNNGLVHTGSYTATCDVNKTFKLGDPDAQGWVDDDEQFDGWFIGSKEIGGANASVLCKRETLGNGEEGTTVSITAKCSVATISKTNLDYITDCNGDASCPAVPWKYGYTDCNRGGSVTVLDWPSGTGTNGNHFVGWEVNGETYYVGDTFTCPDYDTTITLLFEPMGSYETFVTYNVVCYDGTSNCGTVPSTYPETCMIGSNLILDYPNTAASGYIVKGFSVRNPSYPYEISYPYGSNSSISIECTQNMVVNMVFERDTSNDAEWYVVPLHDNNSNLASSSNPQYLCCDLSDNKPGWYGSNDSYCNDATPVNNINVPVSSDGGTYLGHYLGNSAQTQLVSKTGAVTPINTIGGCNDMYLGYAGASARWEAVAPQSNWQVVVLNDNSPDTPSSPKVLCCDLNAEETGNTGWYSGTNASNCGMLGQIMDIRIPVKSGYNYGGHQISSGAYLINGQGRVQTSIACSDTLNGESASAVWTPSTNNANWIQTTLDNTLNIVIPPVEYWEEPTE